MTLGLIEMLAPDDAGYGASEPVYVSPNGNEYRTIGLLDGRQLDYLVIGAPAGAPFLMLPSNIGITRLPPEHEKDLLRRDLTMIVPVRAGFGRSSALPKGRHVYDVAAGDTSALMDRLGIARAPVLALCDDFRLALEMSARLPGRFTALFGCGAPMPSTRPEHYKRMTKFNRFVTLNVQYAPKVVPYVSLVLFSAFKRMGAKRFAEMVLGDSKADVRLLSHRPTLEALMRGTEIAIGPEHTAHDAFAAETLANLSGDWTPALRDCAVPITLFAGHEDPFSPFETVKETCAAIPSLKLVEFADCGQFLYPHFDVVLDAVEAAAKA